jgi:hypothetical protein
MMKRKTSKIISSALLSFALVIGGILIILFGIIPGINRIQQNLSDIKTLTKQNDDIAKKVNFLKNLDETTLQIQMQTLLSAVPQYKLLPTILSILDGVSSETGLNVKALTINTPGPISTQSGQVRTVADVKLGSNSINFAIETTGTIDQLNSFLDKITAIRRLIQVKNINVSITGAASESAVINSSIKLAAFYSPLPKTLGKPSDVLIPLTANEEELITKLNNMPEEFPMQVSPGVNTYPDRVNPFAP